MDLRVEYCYDPESKNWGFQVPSLHIIGGADTREDAERQVLDAIDFMLQTENEKPIPSDGEVSFLNLTWFKMGRRGLTV